MTLLFSYEKKKSEKRRTTCDHAQRATYLEPIGALLAKAEALEAETYTRLATAFCVRPFVAFLEEGEGGGDG